MELITSLTQTKNSVKPSRTVVFYDDSRVFGGHEIMFLGGLEGVLADRSVHCAVVISARNETLRLRLESLCDKHRNLSLHLIAHSSSRFASIRTFLSPLRIIRLRRFLANLRADRAIIVQGNIEFSSLGLVASKLAGIRATSYIPMTGMSASSKNVATGIVKLPFNLVLYRMTDEFITISEAEAARLKRLSGDAPVRVIFNGVSPKRGSGGISEPAFRSEHLIPGDKKIIAVIGRIQFKQKGHDILMRAADRYHNLLSTCHFLIVGNGDDETKMREFASLRGLDSMFTFIPWMDDMRPVYRMADAVLMPSRYEGVPLVAVESVMASVPVILSDRIVALRDIFPDRFFFPLDDREAMISLILRTPRLSRAEASAIEKIFSMDRFRKRFAEACGAIDRTPHTLPKITLYA